MHCSTSARWGHSKSPRWLHCIIAAGLRQCTTERNVIQQPRRGAIDAKLIGYSSAVLLRSTSAGELRWQRHQLPVRRQDIIDAIHRHPELPVSTHSRSSANVLITAIWQIVTICTVNGSSVVGKSQSASVSVPSYKNQLTCRRRFVELVSTYFNNQSIRRCVQQTWTLDSLRHQAPPIRLRHTALYILLRDAMLARYMTWFVVCPVICRKRCKIETVLLLTTNRKWYVTGCVAQW